MWPKNPMKDMQSNRPAVPVQKKMSKKHMPQEDDKNCQSKNYYGSVCAEKKCQATKTSDMWPMKPQMDMWLKEPAYNLVSRRHVYLYLRTITVNPQRFIRNQGVLTRTVKKMKLSICSQ